MAITIDYTTTPFTINVPQGDLTFVQGTLYDMNTDDFRRTLKSIEAAEDGIVFSDTHRHNSEVTVAGTTFFRTIEMINATTPNKESSQEPDEYQVQFLPDSAWTVRLSGSNNNIFDVENGILVQNQVQVISQNSAGGQVITAGSGVTEQDIADIADRVWDEIMTEHTVSGSFGNWVQKLLSLKKFIGLK